MYKRFNKYIFIVVALFCIVFLATLTKEFIIQNAEKDNALYVSLYRIEESVLRNIDNRQFIKQDNCISIGYNKKELENGYYDIKINVDNNKVDIHINKLWKNFNKLLYEKEYVIELVSSICDIFEIEESNQKEILINYIIDGYTKSKKIDKEKEKINDLNVDKIKIRSEIIDSHLVLTICREVNT